MSLRSPPLFHRLFQFQSQHLHSCTKTCSLYRVPTLIFCIVLGFLGCSYLKIRTYYPLKQRYCFIIIVILLTFGRLLDLLISRSLLFLSAQFITFDHGLSSPRYGFLEVIIIVIVYWIVVIIIIIQWWLVIPVLVLIVCYHHIIVIIIHQHWYRTGLFLFWSFASHLSSTPRRVVGVVCFRLLATRFSLQFGSRFLFWSFGSRLSSTSRRVVGVICFSFSLARPLDQFCSRVCGC